MKEVLLGGYKIIITDKSDGSVKDVESIFQNNTYFVKQVHGNTIINIEDLTSNGINNVCADGIFSIKSLSRQCGVYVGDCMPIVLLGKNSFIILHAGRRGLYQGIIHSAVKKLCSHGEDVLDILVYIGPSICKNCFEFGLEAKDHFPSLYIVQKEDCLTVDLWGIAYSQCVFHGIPGDNIINEKQCTMCSDKYFSARRGETGRFMMGVSG